MIENKVIKFNNKKDIVIGFLLTMPIYLFPIILLTLLNVGATYKLTILPILFCSPIIAGIVLSYKTYKDKFSKLIVITLTILSLLGLYYYYNVYFGEYEGWDGLGEFFLLIVILCLCKILLFVFYGKIVGKKKAILCFFVYLLVGALMIDTIVFCVQLLRRPELVRIF